MAEVIIKLDDKVLQTHMFDGELLRVGRSRENDIVLENLSVSRHHIQIRFFEGRYVLFDMNSSNGTFLNGTRVTRRELLDGDQITVGKHSLLWRDTSEQSTVVENSINHLPPSAKRRAPDPRAEAWVKVESGRLKDREFKVIRFETTIGKAATNDIVLTDDWLLSKKQAIILRKGNDEFEIQDLGGLRRLKINGKPVEGNTPLRTGDKLELGGTRLTFYSTAAQHRSLPAQIVLKNNNLTPVPDISNQKLKSAASTPPSQEAAFAPEAPEVAHDDSLDLEELFDPAALLAREAALSNGNGAHNNHREIPTMINKSAAFAAAIAEPPAAAFASARPYESAGEVLPEPQTANSKHELNPGQNDKEIQMWESALNNPSPAIRRQAAKMLKKLTGRDYGV